VAGDRLLRQAGLPQPETNAPVLHPYRADFFFREHGLILEVDGFAAHSPRHAFEHDRERNAKLVAAGYSVMQITVRQLGHEPMAVIARIAEALARRAAAA
jgi:very-short-patch-repair endonuclease